MVNIMPKHKIPEDTFISQVSASRNVHDLRDRLGMSGGGAFSSIQKRIKSLGLSTEHFKVYGETKCKVLGCTEPHLCKGYCNTHYKRMDRHGDASIDATRASKPIVLSGRRKSDFHRLYIPEPMSGCWIWEGKVNRSGYGRFRQRPNDLMAHRVSYLIHFGIIPPDRSVCHKCDNPSCVNPDHLFLGTTRDNMKDKERKGRGKSLRK